MSSIWKISFALEINVIMLMCCGAQENMLRSNLQVKESPQQMDYFFGTDNEQRKGEFRFSHDNIVKGRKTYHSVGVINRRCKGTLCIDFSKRPRRHHHNNQKAYHTSNTHHKHKQSHHVTNSSANTHWPIKSYKFPSTKLSNKDWPSILTTDRFLSNFTPIKNKFIADVITSNKDSVAMLVTKLNKPYIQREFYQTRNKQKIIDSEDLSGRNDLSNFFPNHVSGLKKNFVGNNQPNQSQEKSKTLDESIKQILQNENLSAYFHSEKTTKDADRARLSLDENQRLTSSLNKTINYKHKTSDFDPSTNNSANSPRELSPIVEETAEAKNTPNEKQKSNKVEIRTNLITKPTPAIQYSNGLELMRNVVINKKFNSSATGDDSLSKIGVGNGIKRQINSHKLPSFASFLRQNTPLADGASTDHQCYSVRDLLMVVLITSLANLFAGFIITFILCCISPRLRVLSSVRRTTESFSIGSNSNRFNLSEEEISGNVGCLEACLPDISYQRHVAKDKKSKMPQGKFHSCFHHFQTRRKGVHIYQPGHQRYSSLHKAEQSPLIARKALSLEDIRVT